MSQRFDGWGCSWLTPTGWGGFERSSFLLDQLKPVYSSRHELRSRTGLPVLGTIGVVLMPHQKFITRAQTFLFLLGLMSLVGMYVGAIALEDRFVELLASLQSRGSI